MRTSPPAARGAAAVAAVVVLASGCTSPAEAPATRAPTPPVTASAPSTEVLTSLVLLDGSVVVLDRVPASDHPHYAIEVRAGGVLTTTPGGCLGFEDGGGGHRVAVWPAGTTPLADGTGIDVPGHGPVHVGDEVRASQRGYLGQAPPGDVDAGLPDACQDAGGTLALTGVE